MNRAFSLLILAMLLAPDTVRADGGVVRARETRGPFIVSLFTPPEVSATAPADVTVMVQSSHTGGVVLDAEVLLFFTPPAGAVRAIDPQLCGPLNRTVMLGPAAALGPSPGVRATRAHSVNQLLYGVSAILPAVGDWQVRAAVRGNGEEAFVTCVLPVAVPSRRLTRLWPWLALPPIVITLFGLNQWLRRGQTRRLGTRS